VIAIKVIVEVSMRRIAKQDSDGCFMSSGSHFKSLSRKVSLSGEELWGQTSVINQLVTLTEISFY
jgi:hypothetical protein